MRSNEATQGQWRAYGCQRSGLSEAVGLAGLEMRERECDAVWLSTGHTIRGARRSSGCAPANNGVRRATSPFTGYCTLVRRTGNANVVVTWHRHRVMNRPLLYLTSKWSRFPVKRHRCRQRRCIAAPPGPLWRRPAHDAGVLLWLCRTGPGRCREPARCSWRGSHASLPRTGRRVP